MKEEYLNVYENSTGIIQRQLYDYPLYNYVEEGTGIVNIAILGCTDFSKKFADISLELMQIKGCKVNISIISDNKDAEKEYCKSRPALTKFISINKTSIPEESWGNINFITVESMNNDIIEGILLEDEKTKYAYFVIDLGDFKKNYDFATEAKICIGLTDRKTCVAYVSNTDECEESFIALCARNTLQNHKDYNLLKSLALNCHLVWNSSENLKLQKLRNEFRSTYYFDSSVANVISIKYKLYSVGIEWTAESDLYDVAAKFEKIIVSAKKTIDELVKYEHQRWCINLACDGWKPQPVLENCLNGVKDKINKFHPCLVKSDDKLHLEEFEWKKNNYEKWDTANTTEMEKLDELDRVSVNLHREFKKHSDKLLDSNSYPVNDVNSIRELIKEYPNCVLPFERYVTVIKSIVNKEGNKFVSQYSYNKTKFEKTLRVLPSRVSKMVRGYLNNIDALFFPVFECQKHTNYKLFDFELIKSIPFILTYRTNIRVATPLNISKYDMGNDILFSNIASAIKINPSRVTYCIDYTYADLNSISKAMAYIAKGFEVRNLQTYINLIVFCNSAKKSINENSLNKIKKISKRFLSVKIVYYDRIDDLKEQLASILTSRRFSLLEENDSATYGLLSGMGFYEKLPCFLYDSKDAVFKKCTGCKHLKYIHKKSHLKVSDIVDLKGANENAKLPELQNDYLYFWRFYRGKPEERKELLWKIMCGELKKCCEKNDELFRVDVVDDKKNLEDYTLYVPQLCYTPIKTIIDGLKEYRVLGEQSKIKFHSTSSCKVELTCNKSLKRKIDSILNNPYLLCGDSTISIAKVKRNVIVSVDSLIVNNFEMKAQVDSFPTNDDKQAIIKNLREFARKGYLMNFKETPTGISFCFSSIPIKRLLTNEGLLLEMYVYYQTLASGFFDEIYSGAEITLDDIVSNEFDLLLIKGFKSLIVEVKARTELNQDIYHKLSNLTNQIGINATPILISDTLEKAYYDNTTNENHRTRGDEYGIVTVYKTEQIDSISKTLRNIAKENFVKIKR